MDMIVGKEYDITQLFEEEWQPPKSPLERDKRRGSSRFETEEFYLSVSISNIACITFIVDLDRHDRFVPFWEYFVGMRYIQSMEFLPCDATLAMYVLWLCAHQSLSVCLSVGHKSEFHPNG